ncbi:MAG: 3-isopropylmalate dehydrogenase [Methanomassiliicoccales archaeon]|nr:3-isopropylmalate dehydrogenase [Methanomassiliicoccales archaeon]
MFKVAVIPGDGIGPEVISEGLKVLDALEETSSLSTQRTMLEIGASRYLRTGELLTEDDVDTLARQDAIYFGAIGDLRIPTGVLEKGILLAMRARFDQYVNLRPIRSWQNFSRLKNEAPFNITFMRENTEDFYMGTGGTFRGGKGKVSLRVKRSLYDLGIEMNASSSVPDDFAFEVGIHSRRGVERFVDFVMRQVNQAGLNKVTVVDKANVCTDLYGLWREIFMEKSERVGVELEFIFVDAMAMSLVRNPDRFGSVATPNMFGDILTDLGAELQGSLGLSASGNINPSGISMFEPIHGSAPDIAGTKRANPFGAILAAKLMLDHLGRADLGVRIERGVEDAMGKGVLTPDLGGSAMTSEVGDAVVQYLSRV